MRLEVLLYSQLVLTHVDGLPIRARCFWQKRKAFDGIADDIRDYHFNGTAYYFFASGVFYRLLLNKHNTNIDHASVAEAD
jgi:hypothetical protein